MVLGAKRSATVDDLYRVPDNGKAELVNGELIRMAPSGIGPGRASAAIYVALLNYENTLGLGFACPDNVGFIVDLPNRQSFSQDASFYIGPWTGMDFASGAPVFAVVVRSGSDYGHSAEADMRRKRADYFAAGTLVVWDVDLLNESVIRSFRDHNPDSPSDVFRRGDDAHAEPALPGWRFQVEALFGKERRSADEKPAT